MKCGTVFPGAALIILLLAGGEVWAGRMVAAMRSDSGSHGSINLIVREVKVTPVRAHVGDTIRVDAVIENRGEGRGTTQATLYAGRKLVVSRLFSWGGTEDRIYRETFLWDTKGVAAGEYRMRAEVFVWEDSSPFDNELAVKEPVTLLPAGAAFPAGRSGGGEAVAVDPRWHPERPSPGSGSRNSPASSGIVGKMAGGRMQ